MTSHSEYNWHTSDINIKTTVVSGLADIEIAQRPIINWLLAARCWSRDAAAAAAETNDNCMLCRLSRSITGSSAAGCHDVTGRSYTSPCYFHNRSPYVLL